MKLAENREKESNASYTDAETSRLKPAMCAVDLVMVITLVHAPALQFYIFKPWAGLDPACLFSIPLLIL